MSRHQLLHSYILFIEGVIFFFPSVLFVPSVLFGGRGNVCVSIFTLSLPIESACQGVSLKSHHNLFIFLLTVLVEDTNCFLLASSNRGLYPPCYLLLPLAWSRRGCYTFTFMTIKIVQGSCLGTLFVGRVCGHHRWSC